VRGARGRRRAGEGLGRRESGAAIGWTGSSLPRDGLAGGWMRKRYWLLLADVPVALRFDATMFVSASSLNLREAPNTGGRVITSLSRNSQVLAGGRRSGWVLVSAQGQVGWVSEQYLAGAPVTPSISVPSRSQPGFQVVQQPNAASCPSRQYCTRIGSCEEARWYLANCSWGALLDSDSDSVPWEAICRSRRPSV